MHAVFLDKNTFSIDTTAPKTLKQFTVYEQTAQDDQLIIERCTDADIIITNKVIINANILHSLPKLKMIQITATGTNNVDIAACQACSVAVYNVEGYSIQSVPEHTLMLMLTAMRAGWHYHNQVIHGDWQTDGRFCLNDVPLLDLAGRTLGVIGAGNIGRQVGKLATAFGMKVLYAERQGQPPRDSSYTAFEVVLAQSDIISLHCPLSDSTHHLINDNTIALMTNKPLIINVARGAVVDTQAIVRALACERILGYATDVFEQEPPCANEPLLAINHPRVILTPHNAWASTAAQSKLWQIACRQIDEFVSGCH